MNHEEVVRTYSDTALAGIIQQLTASGEWKARLQAAKAELQIRQSQNLQQDQESLL